MSVITDLGKIVLLPMGNWNSSSTYEFLDIVSNSGSSYVAKKNVPTGTLLNNEDYWQLLSKGANINDLALNFELDNNGYLNIEYGEI